MGVALYLYKSLSVGLTSHLQVFWIFSIDQRYPGSLHHLSYTRPGLLLWYVPLCLLSVCLLYVTTLQVNYYHAAHRIDPIEFCGIRRAPLQSVMQQLLHCRSTSFGARTPVNRLIPSLTTFFKRAVSWRQDLGISTLLWLAMYVVLHVASQN